MVWDIIGEDGFHEYSGVLFCTTHGFFSEPGLFLEYTACAVQKQDKTKLTT